MKALKFDNGNWCYDPRDLKQLVSDLFLPLYSDASTTSSSLLNLCQSWCLTDSDRDLLNMEVSEAEVHSALFAMNPNKSAGFDGFFPGFFQKGLSGGEG